MQVISKRNAIKMQTASLFSPGGTLRPLKVNGGKCKPGSFPVGRELTPEQVGEAVCVYAVNGRDSDGPYQMLWGMYRY